jgi:hypothetical protein
MGRQQAAPFVACPLGQQPSDSPDIETSDDDLPTALCGPSRQPKLMIPSEAERLSRMR